MLSYEIRWLAADNSPLCTKSSSWLGMAAALAEAARDLPEDCAIVELAYPDGSVFWCGACHEVLRFADAR